MPDIQDRKRRRRPLPRRSDIEHEDVTARVATARARGDLDGALSLLEARLRNALADNQTQRTEIRDLRRENEQLSERVGKPTEGHVLVKKEEWEAAQKAQGALTKIGVDAATIEREYPLGRDALFVQSTQAVASAEQLAEAGAKLLARMTKDHKLALTTQTVKDGDRDVVRGYVLVDGKHVPLREHLKQQFAEYEPQVYAGAGEAKGKPVQTGDTTRRMPAPGSTNKSRVVQGTGGAGTGNALPIRQAFDGLRKRYVQPPPNTAGRTAT